MGDAVNIALKKVKTKYTVVIWPDQIFLSINTIKKTINFFLKKKLLLCFPTFKKKFPYVYILRDKDKNFKDIIQTRETRKRVKFGESDCGMFVFNTKKISEHLEYLIKKKKIITTKTKEVDFLKSFKFLNHLGNIKTVKALSQKDTIGVNYLQDLS